MNYIIIKLHNIIWYCYITYTLYNCVGILYNTVYVIYTYILYTCILYDIIVIIWYISQKKSLQADLQRITGCSTLGTFEPHIHSS